MADIEVERLTKRFGDFCAVDAVSFEAGHGEVLGLLGPNGAGKSTLIRMLTTLVPPSGGAARILGFDVVSQADAVRHSIGVIPQAMTSDLDLSAEENMHIFAQLYGIPKERRRSAIARLLAAVDLTQWANKPVKMFSGGMRRRLEIARGLVHEPKVFFLDEPTTGLDPVSRVAVWEMLSRLRQERDLTVVMTTHYMDEADKLCDRIAIVDHGHLVALDSPLRLKASVSAQNTLEVGFASVPAGLEAALRSLPGLTDVRAEGTVFRMTSQNGAKATQEVMEAARAAGAVISSLSVQSATLDDVFAHYTGRQLRDGLQAPAASESRFILQREPR
ncbi:MAG TPA: ATP-binding cassette domain-containing protein [Opitutaceae bacterium]|jgi:ABC-2 type transport system ATP-binding protein